MTTQTLARPIEVSDATFDQDVGQAEKPVLVDFWAAWCGPCRVVAPVLEEIASEYSEQVTVAKVNVDENPEAAARYGVRSIPTLILFKNGEPVATAVGAQPKAEIKRLIAEAAVQPNEP